MKEVEEEKSIEKKQELDIPNLVKLVDDQDTTDAKMAFLSSLKYRQQQGEYSFGHTIWRVYEMMWEKMMAYGHLHPWDDEVEDELCEDIKAWLATMSGHGPEQGREERLKILFNAFSEINKGDPKKRVHKFFNLTGSAAFHHDIGFKQVREKTEYKIDKEEREEIRIRLQKKMDEFERQQEVIAEVQTK